MLMKHHEPLGIGIRQWREQDGVHEGKDRRVRADADGERQHGNGREPRALAKRAERVGHVLPDAVDKLDAARVAALLLAERDRTHLDSRPLARVRERHAGRDVVLDQLLEMVLHLLIELALNAGPPHDRAPTQADLADPAHLLPSRAPAGFTIIAIAADSRSHCAVSTFNAFRPAAVSL